MNEFKGTKGKWVAEKNSHFYEVIKADGSYDFNAMIFCSRGNHSAESEANAKLIAHAPDMLEMLSRVNDLLIRRTLPTESEVNQFAKDIQDLLTRATTI